MAWRRALVITALALAVLAAGEVVARVVAPFELVGGRVVFVRDRNPEHDRVQVREVNGVALWSRPHPDRPPPRPVKQGFRIVVLGDSVLMPAMLPDADGAARVLERLLNAHLDRGPYEVVNLAEGGWNTAQEEALLAGEAMELAPDLVVVGVTSNDAQQFVFADGQLLMVRFLEELDARPGGVLARRSYAWNLLWIAVKGARAPSADDDRHDRRIERRAIIDPLRRMWATARAGRAKFAVLCFPVLVGERFDPSRDGCWWPSLPGWARAAGVPLLDPVPAYARQATPSLRLDDIHLSKLGHEVLAHAWLRFLVEHHLVPYERAPELPDPPAPR